jgi:hypothetical protein
MLLLRLRWLKVRLAREGLLLRRRLRGYPVRAAIEAGVAVIDDRRVVDDGRIHICRPDDGRVHSYRRCVVGKDATAPLTTGKAASTVTKSIIDAAVEANLCTPVATMEDIVATVPPPPIARRPKVSWLRSFYPCSGNPVVVAFAVPGPVAGSPHEVRLRTGRLNVYRKSRRGDVDADANGKLREDARW